MQKAKGKNQGCATPRRYTYFCFVTFAFCLLPCLSRPGLAADVSFNKDIFPILRDNCLACHSSTAKMGELVLESYDSLMKGGKHGPPVLAGKNGESRMVLMLEGKVQPPMPMGGRIKADDLAVIVKWIEGGALGPAASEATPVAAPVIPDIKPRGPVSPEVGSLAFSPDNKLLAVGSYKEVDLLDPATGRRLAALTGMVDEVRSVAFSRDGKWLAAAGGLAGRLGEVVVWNVETRQPVTTIHGHADCIYGVAFSADGRRIATASYDKLIKLWDTGSGQETATLKDHIDSIFALAFSPDGKRIASGAADRTVKLWDAATGQRLFTLGESQDGVLTIAFHPSGKQIAAAGYDKFIRIWDLSDKGGTMAQSTAGHEEPILKISYSPDGKTLVSTSADRSIKIWDAATLEERQVLAHQPDWVLALAFSPDGRRLAAGRFDGSVSIYETATYQEILKPMLAKTLAKR